VLVGQYAGRAREPKRLLLLLVVVVVVFCSSIAVRVLVGRYAGRAREPIHRAAERL